MPGNYKALFSISTDGAYLDTANLFEMFNRSWQHQVAAKLGL